MKIERIELHQVSIPLVRPFETSFGREEKEVHIIVEVYADGLVGFGESPVQLNPGYCYETVETALHVQSQFIAPALLNNRIDSISDFDKHIRLIRGHNMAKHGFECAIWHLLSQKENKPLFQLLGGTQEKIRSGVSVGIEKNIKTLLLIIEGFIAEGYKRIKIKIKPGWDLEPVKAIREQFGDIPLMVDANSAYTMADMPVLRKLDEFGLMMIEQPLNYEDLTDHAQLQRNLSTPICLDESISNIAMAKAAIELKSCKIINIKPARVGGLSKAIKIHDLCQENNIPVWCGGMLEMGIGRAFNIALSSLPNFTLPGDVSSSKRYFHQDIVSPEICFENGQLAVPVGPGFGYNPNKTVIKKFTQKSIVLKN